MSKVNQTDDPVKQVKNRDDKGRFIDGFSGNPNGRPKKEHSITDAIRQAMNADPEIKKDIVSKIITMAKDGNEAAIKLLWNYLDGMPKQSIEVDDDSHKLDILGLIIGKYESDTKQLLDENSG